jgi:hypothetical protein
MRASWITRWVCALASCFVLSIASSAEEPNCSEIHAVAGMAGAQSTALLMSWRQKAGDGYRSKVVFAFRFFELHPNDQHAASAVFDLIPKDREHDSVWHETGALLCPTESSEDMIALGKFGVRLPQGLARAVLLVPSKMFDYVAYANLSCGDPNSDYAVQMQAVCRSKHQEFLKAVDQLSGDAKKWFLSSTFNPSECRALAFPEAD